MRPFSGGRKRAAWGAALNQGGDRSGGPWPVGSDVSPQFDVIPTAPPVGGDDTLGAWQT